VAIPESRVAVILYRYLSVAWFSQLTPSDFGFSILDSKAGRLIQTAKSAI
jgi:hypothetical protein